MFRHLRPARISEAARLATARALDLAAERRRKLLEEFQTLATDLTDDAGDLVPENREAR